MVAQRFSSSTTSALWDYKGHIQLCCLAAISVLIMDFLATAGANPILYDLPRTIQGFAQQIIEDRNARQMKTYSGKRVSNDSLIMIYYHDLTIAVTELGPQKLLLNCELIEIYNDKDGKKLLKNLSKYNRPLEITFKEMITLMDQCERVDKRNYAARNAKNSLNATAKNSNSQTTINLAANIFPRNPFAILSGVVPGTKWCGAGDIADSYHDLGTEINMDRCCRQHDLCPVKIKGLQSKYNLTNDALFTKSHCVCDDLLFNCLKTTNTSASQLMGSVYFNLAQVQCLTGENNHYKLRAAKEGF